jgi:hypothetical protein
LHRRSSSLCGNNSLRIRRGIGPRRSRAEVGVDWTRSRLHIPWGRQRSPTQPARSSAVRRVACPPAAWRAMS